MMPTRDSKLRRRGGYSCLRLIGLTGAAVLVALAWIWGSGAIRIARQEQAAALRRQVQIETELAALERKARALRSANLALIAERGERKAAEAAANEAAAEKERKAVATARGWAKLYYRDLFAQLGLDESQQERFIALVAEHKLQLADLAELTRGRRMTDPKSSPLRLHQEADAAFQAASAELLGPSGVAALAEYDRTAPARSTAAALASNVYDIDPLTAAQAAALIPIFARASSSYQNGGNVQSDDTDWPAVLAQAQSILSAAQLAALQEQHSTNAVLSAMWKRAYQLGYKN